MSDGYHFHATSLTPEVESADFAPGPSIYASALRTPGDGLSDTWVLNSLAEWLPRLGTVLWIDRREVITPTRVNSPRVDRMLLLKHSAASALSRAQSMQAHSAITAQGPREWLSFHDAERELTSRLFLLPDSDCLSWDQMTSASGLRASERRSDEPPAHATFLRRALARFGHRCQARLLVFKYQQTAWADSLDAHAPLRISLLGLDVARTIVRDENAEWISSMHLG